MHTTTNHMLHGVLYQTGKQIKHGKTYHDIRVGIRYCLVGDMTRLAVIPSLLRGYIRKLLAWSYIQSTFEIILLQIID